MRLPGPLMSLNCDKRFVTHPHNWSMAVFPLDHNPIAIP